MHHQISIKGRDIAKLFLTNTFGNRCCLKNWNKHAKLTKLYQVGESRIERELDIIKIMNTLRNVKIILRNSMMSDEVLEQMRHTNKNLINLDSSIDSSCGSAEENFDDINEEFDKDKINKTKKCTLKRNHDKKVSRSRK